ELIGETPCPVCGEIPPIAEELEPEPLAPSAPVPEPALPADASELAGWQTRGLTAHGSPRAGFAVPVGRLGFGLLLGFALGTAAGIGGVFAWQAAAVAGPGDVADNSTPATAAPPASTGPLVLPTPAVTNPTPQGPTNPVGPPAPGSPPQPIPDTIP